MLFLVFLVIGLSIYIVKIKARLGQGAGQGVVTSSSQLEDGLARPARKKVINHASTSGNGHKRGPKSTEHWI